MHHADDGQRCWPRRRQSARTVTDEFGVCLWDRMGTEVGATPAESVVQMSKQTTCWSKTPPGYVPRIRL